MANRKQSKVVVKEIPLQEAEDAATERQFVVFEIGDEVFAADIASVHTVLMPQPVTAVPQTPCFLKGIMNLRGQIVPVIDLRTRFGLPANSGRRVRVVIATIADITAGLVVDAVTEVLRLPESLIGEPSLLLSSVAAEWINGIAQTKSEAGVRLILVLDIHRLLTSTLSEEEVARLAA